MDLADLGHPIDQTGHFGAKLLLDLFQGGQGILDRVVQQAGDDRRHVQLHRGQKLGDLNRVDEVGLPGAALLALMHAFRERVGPGQQVGVGVRMVGLNGVDQLLVGHGCSCPSGETRVGAVEEQSGCGPSRLCSVADWMKRAMRVRSVRMIATRSASASSSCSFTTQ